MTTPKHNTGDVELEDLIAKFEHEFDVATQNVVMQRVGFDGRLGEPSVTLKRTLVRSLRYHVPRLIAAREAEARELERRLIEREVWEAKHREWAEHVNRIKATPIEVIREADGYMVKEMITDIQHGHPDLIRVTIATQRPQARKDGG